MPTYLYETVPERGTAPERFEVRQSMNEPPLRAHPVTGAAIRRVISGGLGLLASKGAETPEPGGCGPQNCGCGKYS